MAQKSLHKLFKTLLMVEHYLMYYLRRRYREHGGFNVKFCAIPQGRYPSDTIVFTFVGTIVQLFYIR